MAEPTDDDGYTPDELIAALIQARLDGDDAAAAKLKALVTDDEPTGA